MSVMVLFFFGTKGGRKLPLMPSCILLFIGTIGVCFFYVGTYLRFCELTSVGDGIIFFWN